MKYVKLLGIALVFCTPLFWMAAQSQSPSDQPVMPKGAVNGYEYKTVFISNPSMAPGKISEVGMPGVQGWEFVSAVSLEVDPRSNQYATVAYLFRKKRGVVF